MEERENTFSVYEKDLAFRKPESSPYFNKHYKDVNAYAVDYREALNLNIKFDEYVALDKAIIKANQSKCSKSKRGVIIWNPAPFGYNFQYVTGYNYRVDKECDLSTGGLCEGNCNKLCVHAEQEALLKVSALACINQKHDYFNNRENINYELLHVKTVDGKPVASERPCCLECSKLILSVPFIRVVWLYLKDGLRAYTPEAFHEETIANVLNFGFSV